MIDVNREQRRASNPLSSVWVAASAGSGKTKVLTDRVLNLLLMNGRPERLLCLTFTKTAAAEMSNRINDVLKSWVTMSDEVLCQAIENLMGDYPEQETLDKARKLFALTLETPGGMKIMTIHSFCQSILKRFPLEAHVSPNFEVMDDTLSEDMLSKIMFDTFKNPNLMEDIAYLSALLDEKTLIKIFKEILSHRATLMGLVESAPNSDTLFLNIKKYFNIDKYQSEKDIISSVCDEQEWDELRKKYIYADSGKKRGIKDKFVDDPQAIAFYEAFQKHREFLVCEATQHLLRVAFYILKEYQSQKDSMALLDYDDLIIATKELLEDSEKTAWVLYKLDGGIDHILVDEAQDTNPDQWSIIRKLAEEFFAGEGRSDAIRTIFAVGDKKQSIYSFQGADPHEFERMRIFFDRRVKESQNDFVTVPLNYSFRSTKPVLDLVNSVLRNAVAKDGVLFKDEEAVHLAFRDSDAGLVEIWPLEQSQKSDEQEGWKPPIERQAVQSAETRLAQKIAHKIHDMIMKKEFLESAGRPVRPGDFLILVQRRRKFVSELVRALKEYNVPVAGVDRLILTNHIAVQDLMALAKFALLQEDDLNLACVLKSPLVGLSEDELFKVCYDRGSESVWNRLKSLFPDKALFLDSIMDQADKMPPFEFFSYILSAMGGRKRFEARLGNEVNEALDEFLNLALTYEQTHTSSLQGFLRFMSEKQIEIKRDLDQSSIDAVRIMTVHGSKGLQGNIVFLPDTRFVPKQRPSFIFTKNNLPLWVSSKTLKTEKTFELFDALDEARLQEYRRLLYVAITRPKDRLYICGWEGKKRPTEGNWYDLIVGSISKQPDEDGIIRFSSLQKWRVEKQEQKVQAQMGVDLPKWIFEHPGVEPTPPKPLTPSRPVQEEKAEETPLSIDQELAMRRGTFIHKLLQYLPTLPSSQWQRVAEKMRPQDIDMPNEIFDLLNNKSFAALFGPNSLAEVPVVGVLDAQVISGQIDRLVVTDKDVLIVDFKSNRRVPKTSDTVPEVYKTQLRTYKALLKKIFPAKIIKSYLLWTQDLSFMEID